MDSTTAADRRRAADRERKRRVRAAEREARAAAAGAREPSASAPLQLASIDDVRAVLEYALQLVGSDVTGSATRRAQVVAQVAKHAADAIVSRELSDRLDAVEQVLSEREQR